MSKQNPFDYVKSINNKQYLDDLSGYNPFLTNKCFAQHLDTILLAEEMNQNHTLGPELQYDFYYYSVRKGSRFGFPRKQEDPPNLNHIMEYFQYSRQKALEALRVLTFEDVSGIIAKLDKGG
jgi:hypothetical protein